MVKNKLIVGNWKMHKTIEAGVSFVHQLHDSIHNPSAIVYLAVPYTLISACSEAARGTTIVIGAQNMSDATDGPFTGEISGSMIKDAGAKFVLIGHSERRHLFFENDNLIHHKVKRALLEGLEPIICLGETLEERNAGKTESVLTTQIEEALKGFKEEELYSCILAYEPVWAIGTGKTATPELAEETQLLCRNYIRKKWSSSFADKMYILYGGSVKPENSREILQQPNIDGLLVGGASLVVDSFSQIINNYQGQKK